jgi:hypothetical protein
MVKTKLQIMEEMQEATQETIITSTIEMENLTRTLPEFVKQLNSVKEANAKLKGKAKYEHEKTMVAAYENHHKKIAIAMANKKAALDSTQTSLNILIEMIAEEKEVPQSEQTKE